PGDRAMHQSRRAVTALIAVTMVFMALLAIAILLGWSILRAHAVAPVPFATIALIAAASGTPLALLLSATQLGLFYKRTIHASWVVIVGAMLGLALATSLPAIRWELVALA